MSFIPSGFNGALSPKLNACVSQDCQNITFSDVTLLSSPANPFGWTTDDSETPRPRILTAFSDIRIIVTSSTGEEIINQLVYCPPINYFPAVNNFTDNMPLATAPWNRPDGVYSFIYRCTYRNNGSNYGDPDNSLGLQGHYVEQVFNKVITCNSENTVKDLWLKYLNDCCGSNKHNALEAEALLFAVQAAASCADEYNASRIKDALDRIIALDSSKCNVCQHSKCKC